VISLTEAITFIKYPSGDSIGAYVIPTGKGD
jgi:hypothetical protein